MSERVSFGRADVEEMVDRVATCIDAAIAAQTAEQESWRHESFVELVGKLRHLRLDLAHALVAPASVAERVSRAGGRIEADRAVLPFPGGPAEVPR